MLIELMLESTPDHDCESRVLVPVGACARVLHSTSAHRADRCTGVTCHVNTHPGRGRFCGAVTL